MALKKRRLGQMKREKLNEFGAVLYEFMADKGITYRGEPSDTYMGAMLEKAGLKAENGREAVQHAVGPKCIITGNFIRACVRALELTEEEKDRLMEAAEHVWDEDIQQRLQEREQNPNEDLEQGEDSRNREASSEDENS